MKSLVLSVTLALVCVMAHAQLGNRLGNAAQNAAERAATRQTERRVEQAVDKAIDGALDGQGNTNTNTGQPQTNTGSGNQPTAPQGGAVNQTVTAPVAPVAAQEMAKVLEMTYAKSDFVAGDEIIFGDPMDNEKMGEFPSQWDLLSGTSEIVMAAGKKGFELARYDCSVTPLMKNPGNYLGDVFTVEFDFLSVKAKSDHGLWPAITFYKAGDRSSYLTQIMSFRKAGSLSDARYYYEWESSNGGLQGSGEMALDYDTWHHIAVSFNKRAWKVYINGVRVVNVPNVSEPPGWFKIHQTNAGEGSMLFSNFRVAKGAVPLYDRMISEGKFITYGITFDVGKSTVKPESMGEINRIVGLMKENPDLKFSVEGHTDSTGSAATNQTLSEARSQAVVDKLVENGIAANRLKAAGKGQTSPLADNGTDEGRAKNRRVEFVKF